MTAKKKEEEEEEESRWRMGGPYDKIERNSNFPALYCNMSLNTLNYFRVQ